MNLSFEKRLTVARTIAAANAGHKPLILGSGFFAMDDIIAFMEATKDLQFDAYHVMPYHPLLGLDGMEKFYRDLAARAPKPLWMYTSANWCRAFPPDFVARLRECPNIAGIKFSTSRTTDQINVIAMAAPEFQVITAVATQFFAVLSLGVAGSTTSLAGALPEPLIDIYSLYQAGRRDDALAAQHKLNAFLRRLPSRPKAWNFLGAAEEKYILSLRGICGPYVTSYYTPLTEEERSQVRATLDDSGYAAMLQEPVDRVGAT
jgi:4-hydroxy-tetrahydrodipicolinate synthase